MITERLEVEQEIDLKKQIENCSLKVIFWFPKDNL